MRIPKDAIAHIDLSLGAAALTMMERNMRAHVLSAKESLGDLPEAG